MRGNIAPRKTASNSQAAFCGGGHTSLAARSRPRRSWLRDVPARALWFNSRLMFQPLEWFIGLRYLRSRRWRALVSFRTAASLLGLALGVTALIVILSVLNGLEAETRTRLLALSAHATVSAPDGLRRLARARAALRERAGRRGRHAVRAPRRHARRRRESAAGDRARHLAGRGGRGLGPGARSSSAARSRICSPASTASCSAACWPRTSASTPATPCACSCRASSTAESCRGCAAFTVGGVIDAGVPDHDTSLALVHLADASELKGLGRRRRRRRAEVRRSVSRARVRRRAARRARARRGATRTGPRSTAICSRRCASRS